MGVLRRAADRQRAPRLPPRPGPGVQGHLPAVQDDAWLSRRAQGRLGLPRPAGGDRRGKGAGDLQQGGDRGLRHRRVQREVPRLRLHVPEEERAHRAHRLDRPGRRHARSTPATSSRSGGRSSRSTTRTCSTRLAVCTAALRHRPLQPRGRAGLQGRRGCLGLRALPGGGRRRGAARLDDHPVDPALQRGGGRRSRPRLRARPARRHDLHPRRGPRHPGAGRGGRDRRSLPRPRS